jgi:hypothetical protein
LREALAAADHDFVLVEPASRSKRTRANALGAKRRGASRPTWRYRGIVASALCAATIAGILVNALVLQKTRHPAPLFARAAPPSGVKEPSIAEPTPLPAPRPSSNAAAADPTNDKPPAQKSPAEKLQAEPAQLDPIAQLLRTPPTAREEKPAASAALSKSAIAAAQRALMKLGFVLEGDGVAGKTTRQAIERYERDRGLPVKGELTPKLLRRLGAESGISIN